MGRGARSLGDSAKNRHSGGVKKTSAATAATRVAYASETLKRGTALYRGSQTSNRQAPSDVGFFYFDSKHATRYAWMHVRGNIPTTSTFVTIKPLKLFVMNERNLHLLLSVTPRDADLQRSVRAVTGVGMHPQELYDKYRYTQKDQDWKIHRCVGTACTYAGVVGGVVARTALGRSIAASVAAGALGTVATGVVATGLHRPRRSRTNKMEIHDSGFLSQVDFHTKTIASKRLALDMQAALGRAGFDGWVFADRQERARALIDPRRLGGGGKFEREVMLWSPSLKLQQTA